MQKIYKYNFFFINVIFMMFPISIILGNFAINLNMLILFLVTLITFLIKKENIKLEINIFDKLILLFFFYSLISLVINYAEKLIYQLELNDLIVIKTILYQRYLIFYFVIRILQEKKIIQINWFNIICAICATFVILDIFYQFFFGKDFFGIISPSSRHYSAIFGDELVAGGYLQKFSLFIIFFWHSLKKNTILKKKHIIILLSIFILSGIILSGNRMPFILFLLSLVIYAYISADLKKIIKKILFFSFFFFLIFIFINKNLKIHFYNYYNDGLNLITKSFFTDLSKEPPEVLKKPYISEFYCSRLFIKENPIFGGGIRSYRTHYNSSACFTHSHNYYLEILVDLGIVGLIILVSIIILIIKKIILNNKNKKPLPINIFPFLIILCTEFFPFRTSGSFFSTVNSVLIFMILALLIGSISSKDKKVNNS